MPDCELRKPHTWQHWNLVCAYLYLSAPMLQEFQNPHNVEDCGMRAGEREEETLPGRQKRWKEKSEVGQWEAQERWRRTGIGVNNELRRANMKLSAENGEGEPTWNKIMATFIMLVYSYILSSSKRDDGKAAQQKTATRGAGRRHGFTIGNFCYTSLWHQQLEVVA